MKKTFFKNLFRDIRKTMSRFLSIVIIIAIGVAFYVGIRAASPAMNVSGDSYFARKNFMDFKLISTLGLTNNDLREVQKIKGIAKAEGSYSMDALIQKEKKSLVLNINSQPDENSINSIEIVRGRKAERQNEVVVEERFFKDYNLKLNDKIVITSGNDTKIDESLKNNEFKIVGTANSPLYIYIQRQISTIGNGTVSGFLYILPEVFKSKVYTEIYVRTDKTKSNDSLSNNESYKKYSESMKREMEEFGVKRSEIRYEEVLKTAQAKLTEMMSSSKMEATNLENMDKLKEIKKPEWYVLGRFENVGYETYRQFNERIDNIGKLFPLIFFLVAALVSLTTMTRMVQEKRIEIGTFKALGYSRRAIVSHYLIYALLASILGSIIGIVIGHKFLPSFIINAFSSRFDIPDKVIPFQNDIAMQASVIAVLFTAVAAAVATLEELREVPASLMRPKPPKAGKKIFLERIGFIWKRLGFTKKVTARNIFRYKQRLIMTVVGISACTGLMIAGFGIKEGVVGGVDIQFSSIYKYDINGILDINANEDEKNHIKENVMGEPNIKNVLFNYSKNCSIKIDSLNSQDAYMVVFEDKDAVNNYINLTMRGDSLKLEDNGVIITEKLSKLIDKKVGDTIFINLKDNNIKVRISAVTEQYVLHYIYMSRDYYKKIVGDDLTFNGFYGVMKNKTEADQDNTINSLKSIDGISSAGLMSTTKEDYNVGVQNIGSIILILITAAGTLAFVVIYNLTNINISERIRELATIKLLGFYNKELAAYIYRENTILTIMGSLLGIPVGIMLDKLILATAETNEMMCLQRIDPVYFVISILLTISFSVVVNLAMYVRFDRINMIESLKSAE